MAGVLWVSANYFRTCMDVDHSFLDVRYNDRWHTFTPGAAKGGQAVPAAPAEGA